MKKTITLPCKPLSINAMYCKNRSWKTAEFKDWSCGIFHRLSSEKNLQTLKELREHFDSKKHHYKVDLVFQYPHNILFTKKSQLSARAHDISNIEKPIIDLIFLPDYFKKPSPYGCENLNIDDKFISSMSSKKIAGEDHEITIKLSILSLEDIIPC